MTNSHAHRNLELWHGSWAESAESVGPQAGHRAGAGDSPRQEAVGKPFEKWVIPVRVHGAIDFNLLAVWACPVGTKRADNYIGQVYRCLVEQSGWFGKAPLVVAGDLNSNSQWDANRPGRNHTEVVRLFESHGLISAYHAHNGENQGAETLPTYYFYRHQDKPFHIDYVFVPKDWKLRSVEVGAFREWGHLSDHVPVVVDLNIPDIKDSKQ